MTPTEIIMPATDDEKCPECPHPVSAHHADPNDPEILVCTVCGCEIQEDTGDDDAEAEGADDDMASDELFDEEDDEEDDDDEPFI